MRKIYGGCSLFAIVCYMLAHRPHQQQLRCAFTMRGDLKMTAAEYGFGRRHLSYWAYFLFEVLVQHHPGEGGRAHLDHAHHDLLGHLRDGHGLRHSGTTSFGIIRFLLGMGEAGFFPGLILYFTYWLRPATMPGSSCWASWSGCRLPSALGKRRSRAGCSVCRACSA